MHHVMMCAGGALKAAGCGRSGRSGGGLFTGAASSPGGARTRGGARPVAGGNKARTPLLPVAKSGGAAESGGSLLKTILNGGKSFGRVPKT